MWRYLLRNRISGQTMMVEGKDLSSIQFDYKINISDWIIMKSEYIKK